MGLSDTSTATEHAPQGLSAVRARLAQARGKTYWRSLEELADTAEFKQLLRQEYPREAAVWDGSISRRRFLQLIGASLALAGVAGCTPRSANEKIVPYVRQPEGVTPGVARYFATAALMSGYALGVLAESHEGRPTKLEGNPEHPASLGATNAFAQALILQMYDPDRSQAVLNAGRESSWQQFTTAISGTLGGLAPGGLRILTGTVTSPTMSAQLADLLGRYEGARWHRYEPVGDDNSIEGARLALGEPLHTYYDFSAASVIVSLDANFLYDDPASVRYQRQFTDGRRVEDGRTDMNRLYVVESDSTITGAMADHRWALPPGGIQAFAQALAAALGVAGATPIESAVPAAVVEAIARDLQANGARTVIVAGRGQPPAVHALAHAMNAALGNIGTTVFMTAPVDAGVASGAGTLAELVSDLNAGSVGLLVILGGNPVYDAPVDLAFADALAKAGTSIHLGLYADETAQRCTWHIPEAHSLEAWSDARAFDGTVTLIQPLIQPLYDGKSAHELLAVLLGAPDSAGYDLVRTYWQAELPGDFETAWATALHDGVVADTALPVVTPTVAAAGDWLTAAPAAAAGLHALFVPDPSAWDGRYANNGWLQELPRPLTKLTWDNVALFSPATAERLGLVNGDVVNLTLNGRSVRGPVWIMPGHADDTVTLPLGYGRQAAGRVGSGVGFNAYALRTSDAPWFAAGLEVAPTGERIKLATTQMHYNMEGRDLVQTAAIEEFRAEPELIHERIHHPEGSIYTEWKYEGHAWGMSIDLNACVGCNACVVACVAENNIPVVGKEQVLAQREMHWLRIDTYFEGDPAELNPVFQPMMCQQCENAPCEPVCPVGATVHSSEGLNDMVYNRCVGTRYCANNCPYKVRRFNFLQFADWDTESLKPLRNPDVTVRQRGVMEKCTFCVQRIEEARSAAIREGREIRDGDVTTACQQACPTRAITFGDINSPNAAVTQRKSQPQDYGVLTHLNTKPRTTYMARFTNPNPEIQASSA